MQSHAHQVTVASGTRLSALLGRASPGIRQHGWSWVAVADGRVAAVWSVDHGVQLLVPDSRVTSKGGPHSVHFRYFLQIDPAWLHRRLIEGAVPNLKSLEREYQPLARVAWEQEQRRRENELPDRLLTAECTSALQSFGAQIDLHNDRTIRFNLFGTQWTASGSDTMIQIHSGEGGPAASIRPSTFAECWLVAAVGAEMRISRDIPRLPHFQPLPAPRLKPMTSWPPGVQRWTTNGNLIAQLSGADAVSYFRIAVGRSIAEIAELLTEDLPLSHRR
ncbi:hypothetical protein [Microbacterium sp. A84]